MSTVITSVDHINECTGGPNAPMFGGYVETTDVTYLVRDANLAEVLNKKVGESHVFYIPCDNSQNISEVHRIGGWTSKSYVLIGNFSHGEIQYIKSRCRSR